MLTAVASIKTFMDDMRESIFEYKNNYYQKVVLHSKNLTLLYVNEKEPTLSNSDLSLVGIYSNTKKRFICITSDYRNNVVFINDYKEFSQYEKTSLENELNQLIKIELLNILNLQIKPNTLVTPTIRKEAESYFKNNTVPTMSFEEYTSVLNFYNIEQFLDDKQDYAFECAEEIILNTPKLVEDYQYCEDVKYALSQIQNDTPIELSLHSEIECLINDTNYKNYNLVLTKDGINEISKDNVPIKSLQNYPYYAIKKVYWGRKLLFSIDDYDSVKINELKDNELYNINALINCAACERSEFLSYVNPDIFKSFEFCNAIVKYASTKYSLIDVSYRENISFIQKHMENLHLSIIIENVSESFILKNEKFFLDCIKGNMEYVYSKFPKSVQEKESFLLKLISVDGKYALSIISEQRVNDVVIQKAFDDWFDKNPILIRTYYHDDDLNLKKLKNKTTILNAMNLSNMKNVDTNLLNDLNFMNLFLNKIKNEITLRCEHFYNFYMSLDILKTDLNFMLDALKIFRISEFEFDNLDNIIKDNDDVQKEVIKCNPELLFKMKDSIKEEFVLDDTEKYLQYYNKKNVRNSYYSNSYYASSNNNTINIDLFEKIVKSSLTKPKNLNGLQKMSYSQKSDEALAKKLIKINPYAYSYFDEKVRNNEKIVEMLLKQKISVIPYLPKKTKWNSANSLFDNKEIMKKCLEIEPLDFQDIPEESRQTGKAPLLKDKDFILFVMKLEPYNIRFLSMKSPFREDVDIARETLLLSAEYATEFAGKLFRDETFVYSLLSETLKKYQNTVMYDDKIKEVNEYIMTLIPKKIKNSKDFVSKFPMFKEI